DPIDGTESFVRGLPVFRNQAALIDHGQPVYSIAYRPVTDDFFIAHKGKGTYRNGQKLQFSQRPLERVRLEVWAKFADPGIATILSAIEAKIENIRFTDEYLYVVEGKLDAHLAWRPKIVKLWDHAPRALLLAEAGAKLTNIGSDHYDINDGKWLAANPEVFDELMAAIVNNVGQV
ncbi:MAG TPA: inositol monophosphatase family protein, partial [Candidatus Saccharimonadales bacterium]